ncbi:MAG TPA: AAA family ATPase [Gemmataceae bacterium]|nr:AAA family ATPase [Gemmataceae bacterium]
MAQFISFGGEDEVPVTSWLWHGLLAPGKITLLTSLWKSGKSTLLAHFLAHRRRGRDFFGLATTPGATIVVSEEGKDLWPMRRRRLGIGGELGVMERPFVGCRPTLTELRDLNQQILDLKAEHGVNLVVFDSLATFLPASTENNSEVVLGAMAPFVALAEAGLAVLLPHHPTKGEPKLGQAARGSGALMAASDIILEMRHPGGNPWTRRRKLFGWSRHDETPREMLIELSPDGRTYERLADAGDDFHEHWDLIRIVLRESREPLTRQEIRAAWPVQRKPDSTSLWRWLERAVEHGLCIRTGKGTKTEPYRFALG